MPHVTWHLHAPGGLTDSYLIQTQQSTGSYRCKICGVTTVVLILLLSEFDLKCVSVWLCRITSVMTFNSGLFKCKCSTYSYYTHFILRLQSRLPCLVGLNVNWCSSGMHDCNLNHSTSAFSNSIQWSVHSCSFNHGALWLCQKHNRCLFVHHRLTHQPILYESGKASHQHVSTM